MRLLVAPLALVLLVGCETERPRHVAGDGASSEGRGGSSGHAEGGSGVGGPREGSSGSSGSNGGGRTGGGAGLGGNIAADAPSCERLEQEGLLCRDNWCWLLDGDQGFSLYAAHALSTFATYAVGAAGTILRHEGGRWHREESGTDEKLIAVDGLPSGQVWAAAENGAVLRRLPGGWHALPRPGEHIDHMVVTGANEVWVTADTGLHRWSESRWEAIAVGKWTGLAVDVESTVWATKGGSLFRWSGTDLQRVVEDAGHLVARRAAAPLLAIGNQLLEWRNGALRELFSLDGALTYIRKVIEDTDGSLWVYATYDRTGFGYDVSRHLFHWDGSALQEAWLEHYGPHAQHTNAPPHDLALTWDGVLLVGGNGRAVRVTETGAHEPVRNGGGITDLLPLAEDEIWAFRYGRSYSLNSLRWSSGSWSVGPVHSANEGDLAGTGPNDVWAIAFGHIEHWNGSVIVRYEDDLDWNAVHAVAADDAWAVGKDGVAAHWDGDTWSEVESGTEAELTHLWASGPDDVWAAGETIIHWDGTRWSAPPGLPEGLTKVWSLAGATSTDVWAASDAGLLHWDGFAWSQIDGPQPRGARQVWTAGGDGVFVSSTDGERYGWYRREANGWRKIPFEGSPDVIAGPPRLGIASFGDALARFCR